MTGEETREIRAAELDPGHEVIAGGEPLGFVVRAIDQFQGRVQVTDTDGYTYTFGSDESLQIR